MFCLCNCKGNQKKITANIFFNFFLKNRKIICIYSRFTINRCTFALLTTYFSLMEQVTNLVETIVKGIQEKKGSNITIADLSGIDGTICHYFIICQGNSPTQVEAIADSVEEFARVNANDKPTHVVGLENAQWVAMDYTDVMVHVFLPEVREYYDLESLWQDAKLTHIPDLD